MIWVDRDTNGRVVGRYMIRQYEGQEFLLDNDPSLLPPPPTAADLMAYANKRGYEFEIRGVTVGGVNISTLREHQSALKNARDLVADGTLAAPISIVAGNVAMTADLSTLTALVAAVAAHVQNAFSRRAALLAAIESGAVTTVSQIDVEFV